jgi:hypothetical protein
MPKSDNYEDFVEKFKPKMTTDDCYTPQNVYDSIAEWVAAEYDLDSSTFVRPFYPGGDYEKFDYTNKIVVDNPPFSILSKILKFYDENNIKAFLFAPSLTIISSAAIKHKYTCIITDSNITYANGANVKTGFITNLDKPEIVIRSAPSLYRAIKAADDINRNKIKIHTPKYEYPDYVLTSARMNKFSRLGVNVEIKRNETAFIRQLDDQRPHKKQLFGSGLLLSENNKNLLKKAEDEAKINAEKAASADYSTGKYVWKISEREKKIIDKLSEKKE